LAKLIASLRAQLDSAPSGRGAQLGSMRVASVEYAAALERCIASSEKNAPHASTMIAMQAAKNTRMIDSLRA
jgi:hypothetical protein